MRTADTRADSNTNGNGVAVMPRAENHFVFPDPPESPERPPDEKMTIYTHLNYHGIPYLLRYHFGDSDTTIIDSEHYLSPAPTGDMTGLRYPDLLIAFDADPAALVRSNAYVISEQGKPPDFILEVASRSTGRIDTGAKRDDYEALGVLEYWRFDETGEYHGTRLAGDRLTADGKYEPIAVSEVSEGVLEGCSAALNLNLRWEAGQLKWHDPDTGQHISTFESERERADREQARADALEAELSRLRGG